MKKIEVKLSLPVVAPLLDVIKEVSDALRGKLAASLDLSAVDADFRESWIDELVASQNKDLHTLLALFDSEFFANGVITFDSDNAEPIVRACSAVRLYLRGRYLAEIGDEVLESGEADIEALPEPARRAFMCYLFLATVQELIIQHLDSSILEG